MKREEQISNFANNYAKSCYAIDDYESYASYAAQEDIAQACIDAINWADEHPREGLVDVELILKEIDKRLELVKDPFEYNIHTTRIVEVYESLKGCIQRWCRK